MAFFGRFYIDVLLFMVIVFIAYNGVAAQGKDAQCFLSKSSKCRPATGGSENNKQKMCSGLSTYISCIQNAMNECNVSTGKDMLERAQKQLKDHGCSGAGLPVVSVLCLLVATVFHLM
ncbi:uncharacterized protein LOC133179427 [Saccostrea echinata]|uniref:uncharacterized protein LOC133179427 n=1 Tax=Saccostrea echinata TaxID=191078 RepID=UPI002A83D8CE|nr:uncharacterized protein LOC133179427 [Saccostrea echinata]